MKRRLLTMAAVVVAMLSSCETFVEQKVSVEVLPAVNEQVVFTAGLGVDTKTYLEYEDGVYKTRWSEGDKLFLLGTSSDGSYKYETINILDGIGTSTGTFAGTVQAENYFAMYGPGTAFKSGEWLVSLQQYQYAPKVYDYDAYESKYYDNIDGNYCFPMYAASTSTTLNFQNLCSILKVGLTGTDYIDNVILTPNDPTAYVAGDAFVELVDGEPQITFDYDTLTVGLNSVCYYLRETLDPDQVKNCYISIPPQTFKGGFKLTINSNHGSMEVNITEDVTFERSQIRAIPQIKYENETTNTWGLIGSMTSWAEDIVMTPYKSYQILEGQYLEAGTELKFRANGTWDLNLGAAVNNQIIPGETMQLEYNAGNLIVTETGYYDIILDVANAVALFEIEEPEYVECASYAEIAALENGTKVLVQGFVLVPYARGFVMNIGNSWGNSILVYQGIDQSMYTPVMGNQVAVLAEKITYNNLPELSNIEFVEVLSDQERDYGYNYYYELYTPEAFDNTEITDYQYVKFAGTLKYTGIYYNVEVEGATRVGSIEYPLMDLTPYFDKKVSVEGWFIGYTSQGKYLKVVLRNIATIDSSGSTEDVIPGDDIAVTKVAAKASKVLR